MPGDLEPDRVGSTGAPRESLNATDDLDVQFWLGDWATDRCGHVDAAPPLPRLWVAVEVDGRPGWAHLAFHWVGQAWALCDPATWSDAGRPDRIQLDAWADHALRSANAIPASRWMDDHRAGLRDALRRARAQLEWTELRVGNRQILIRQLECAAAVADLTDPSVAAIAHRLLPTWTGSAETLVSTAHTVNSQRGQ